MPHARRTLTVDAALRASQRMFEPSVPEAFGIELEWPLHQADDHASRPTPAQIAALQDLALPSGGRVTFEPGGQVELSTAPAASLSDCLDAADIDTHVLHSRLRQTGLVPSNLAVDYRRSPERVLQRARYQAMESFFGQQGSAGAWMMCNTASTQVNLSHDQHDPVQRWRVMHLIAPVLIAAFANSPGVDASGRQWASMRQAIWWSIDPGRTRPVMGASDPATGWLNYAMDADVMFMRGHDHSALTGQAVAPGLSFARWMSMGHPAGWPTIEDFSYHLSTLFPPVRPRGWLELRVLDALPDWIRNCAAVTVAGACTREAGAELISRLPDTSGLWLAAARQGLRHPDLRHAAMTLFEVVQAHLDAVTYDDRLIGQLGEFVTRYEHRARCPGDDLNYSSTASTQAAQHRTPVLTCI